MWGQPNPRLAAFAQLRRPRIYGGEQARFDAPQGEDAAEAAARAVEALEAGGDPETPEAPAPRPGRPPEPGRGPSRRMGIIDDVLSGHTISTARRMADAREAAAREQAEMQSLADSLDMDPRERLVFMSDPEAWAKAHATEYETRALGHSDTVHTPGRPDYQPAVTPYDQRSLDDAKAKDDALAANRASEAERRAAADAERERHNRAGEGVASTREARQGRSRSGGRSRRPEPPRAPSSPWDKYR